MASRFVESYTVGQRKERHRSPKQKKMSIFLIKAEAARIKKTDASNTLKSIFFFDFVYPIYRHVNFS